jgi:hypothetical protein
MPSRRIIASGTRQQPTNPARRRTLNNVHLTQRIGTVRIEVRPSAKRGKMMSQIGAHPAKLSRSCGPEGDHGCASDPLTEWPFRVGPQG